MRKSETQNRNWRIIFRLWSPTRPLGIFKGLFDLKTIVPKEQASRRVRPDMVLQPLVATLSLSLTVGSRLSSTSTMETDHPRCDLRGSSSVWTCCCSSSCHCSPCPWSSYCPCCCPSNTECKISQLSRKVVQPCQMEPASSRTTLSCRDISTLEDQQETPSTVSREYSS